MAMNIRSIDDFQYKGKTVLVRVDINSPVDPVSGKITNENRIDKSIGTIRDLSKKGAKIVLIAHQGDTLDYHNLISLQEHAQKLTEKIGKKVGFIDDVAGPAARQRIRELADGEILLLENLRYLTEEVSTFENDVKLTPEAMTKTYLVRSLAPLMDYYVNDAFAAAHRNSPSMVAFQELLPSAGGRLLIDELKALSAILESPARPCVFVLGGLKISDAFAMMKPVLSKGIADTILTTGVTGLVMLMAQGIFLGEKTEKFIKDRSLDKFVTEAKEHLGRYPDKFKVPRDLAFEQEGKRVEVVVESLPVKEMIVDIGEETIRDYESVLKKAGTIFVNGPPGVYEKEISAKGTKRLWAALTGAPGFSVIGGGDTVGSASRFIDTSKLGFVCTGGGALIRYLGGKKLPLLEAMEKAAARQKG
jgi:phosphoglycerate kinase